jgi:hypothetical protein
VPLYDTEHEKNEKSAAAVCDMSAIVMIVAEARAGATMRVASMAATTYTEAAHDDHWHDGVNRRCAHVERARAGGRPCATPSAPVQRLAVSSGVTQAALGTLATWIAAAFGLMMYSAGCGGATGSWSLVALVVTARLGGVEAGELISGACYSFKNDLAPGAYNNCGPDEFLTGCKFACGCTGWVSLGYSCGYSCPCSSGPERTLAECNAKCVRL